MWNKPIFLVVLFISTLSWKTTAKEEFLYYYSSTYPSNLWVENSQERRAKGKDSAVDKSILIHDEGISPGERSLRGGRKKKVPQNEENSSKMQKETIHEKSTKSAGNATLTQIIQSDDANIFVFPTVDERVKYYMGSWWGDDSSHIRLQKLLYPHQDGGNDAITLSSSRNKNLCNNFGFYDCDENCKDDSVRRNLFTVEGLEKTLDQKVSTQYSSDVLKYLVPKWIGADEPVFLLHFGDGAKNAGSVPVMVKTRPSSHITKGNDEYAIHGKQSKLSSQAIIVPLVVNRHFDRSLNKIKSADKPWAEKKNTLIWRGASTGEGRRRKLIEGIFYLYPEEDVNVGLTNLHDHDLGMNAERLVKPSMVHDEMLSYKYLLSIEGNDVATNLKWMLYSNSVVFMPRPTVVSWAMEDMLVPFYHYIPLKDDLSDIHEKILWARENDNVCRRIAEQATKYMEDLWMSEKAQEETDAILSEIVDRYRTNYGEVLRACIPTMTVKEA